MKLILSVDCICDDCVFLFFQETITEGGERDESRGVRHEHTQHQDDPGPQQHRGVNSLLEQRVGDIA